MKILFVHSSFNNGGITNVLKVYAKNLIKVGHQVDFFLYNKGNNIDNELFFKNLGCSLYYSVNPSKHPFKSSQDLSKILKVQKYDVVHSCNYFNSGFSMKVAFNNNVPVRITHSHASKDYHSNLIYKIYTKYMRYCIKKYSTILVACSEKAGYHLFQTNNFIILENPIESQKFNFNLSCRNTVRLKYSIPNNAVLLGSVGMIYDIKNHTYLLDILAKLPNNYMLMIVGDGKLSNELKEKAKILNISNRLIITGWVSDTSTYYSAFDIFVFPSISEGLPLSLIEAQANGLYCIASNNITHKVNIKNNIKFLPITIESQSLWINEITNFTKSSRENIVVNSLFDAEKATNTLLNLYNNNLHNDFES